jgi:DNA-binding MarR family transcriptional regulator
MSDTVSLTEAARLLGVTNSRVTAMVQAGLLTPSRSPHDKRTWLVSRAEVEQLAALRAERKWLSDKLAGNLDADNPSFRRSAALRAFDPSI